MDKIVYLLLFLVLILPSCWVTPAVYAGEGHDAGYEWAELHDITDVNYDEGNSESFNEGVREYAEEAAEEEESEEADEY